MQYEIDDFKPFIGKVVDVTYNAGNPAWSSYSKYGRVVPDNITTLNGVRFNKIENEWLYFTDDKTNYKYAPVAIDYIIDLQISNLDEDIDSDPQFYQYNPDDVPEDDTVDFDEFHLEDADYILIDEIHDKYINNKNIRNERQELIDMLNINCFDANTILISYLGYDKDEVLALPFDTEIN